MMTGWTDHITCKLGYQQALTSHHLWWDVHSLLEEATKHRETGRKRKRRRGKGEEKIEDWKEEDRRGEHELTFSFRVTLFITCVFASVIPLPLHHLFASPVCFPLKWSRIAHSTSRESVQ